MRAFNAIRRERGLQLLPHVTPHTLRRTFISLRLANNAEAPNVMNQVGYVDQGHQLRMYAKVISRHHRRGRPSTK
jgi:integrase